jgi:hypothetical protein
MRDLFDDFLEELRRREAIARGEDPDAAARKRRGPDSRRDDGDGNGDDGDDDRPTGQDDDRDTDDKSADHETADDDGRDKADDDEPASQPVSITSRRRRRRRRSTRRTGSRSLRPATATPSGIRQIGPRVTRPHRGSTGTPSTTTFPAARSREMPFSWRQNVSSS